MNLTVRAVSDNSVNLALEGAPTHIAVQWQVDLASGDFSTPKIDTGDDAENLTTRWLTDLPQGVVHKARARVKVAGPSYSAWTAAVTFKTRRVAFLGTSLFITENEGSDPSIVGEYQAGTTFLTPGFPELVVPLEDYAGLQNDTGFRARMRNALGLYSQAGLPTSLKHCVKYDSPDLMSAAKTVTMIFVFIPEKPDLGFPYGSTIAGGQGTSFWLYEYNGVMGGMRGKDGLHGLPLQLPGGGPLRIGEPNLCIIKHRTTAWHLSSACPGMPVIDSPMVYAMWLNGTKISGGDVGALNGFGSYGGCHSSDPPPAGTDFTNFYQPTITIVPPIYVGVATAGAQTEQFGGDHGFIGIFSEFAWCKDLLISDDDARQLYVLFSSGDMDRFALAVKALDPLVYDRYAQPKRPEKPEITATVTG